MKSAPVGLHDGQAQGRRPSHRLVGRRDDAGALRQPVHDGRRAVEQLAQAVDDELHGIAAASSDGSQDKRCCNKFCNFAGVRRGMWFGASFQVCQHAELAEC